MQKCRDTATHTKSGLQRFKFGTGIVLSSTNMIYLKVRSPWIATGDEGGGARSQGRGARFGARYSEMGIKRNVRARDRVRVIGVHVPVCDIFRPLIPRPEFRVSHRHGAQYPPTP